MSGLQSRLDRLAARQDQSDGIIPANPTAGRDAKLLCILCRECGPAALGGLKRYGDPVRYTREALHLEPIDIQEEILTACTEPPFRIAIRSGQGLGKSHVMATVVNWRYDCYVPGIIATTGPTKRSVEDILWMEIREQRRRNHLLSWDFKPIAPEMRRSETHWAKGFVASKGEAFKGRHHRYAAYVFDEAIALAEMYYRATKGMFQPGGDHLWILGFNPTDPTAYLYQELAEAGPERWRQFGLSSLDHPNVAAAMEGRDLPVPAAVTFGQISDAVLDLCTPVAPGEELEPTDFYWPPIQPEPDAAWTTDVPLGKRTATTEDSIWRSSSAPDFESDWRGLWPTAGPHQVWPDALWQAVTREITGPIVGDLSELPQVGIDSATTGDACEFHLRWARQSIDHRVRRSIRPSAIIGEAIDIARHGAELFNAEINRQGGGRPLIDAKRIPIVIDDDALGRAVADLLKEQGYRVHPVNASTRPLLESRYPNKRSELWFQAREKAYRGLVNLGRLPRKVLEEMRRQFCGVTWWLDSASRRTVEPKEDMKDRIGRSPDSADAVNLAYYSTDSRGPEWVETKETASIPKDGSWRNDRYKGLFGQR